MFVRSAAVATRRALLNAAVGYNKRRPGGSGAQCEVSPVPSNVLLHIYIDISYAGLSSRRIETVIIKQSDITRSILYDGVLTIPTDAGGK